MDDWLQAEQECTVLGVAMIVAGGPVTIAIGAVLAINGAYSAMANTVNAFEELCHDKAPFQPNIFAHIVEQAGGHPSWQLQAATNAASLALDLISGRIIARAGLKLAEEIDKAVQPLVEGEAFVAHTEAWFNAGKEVAGKNGKGKGPNVGLPP